MRILVVDDHRPTIELMRLTLTSFGHSVLSATSVPEALRVVAADHPDVILSDLHFSSTAGSADDGHALARAVRSGSGPGRVGMLAITGAAAPAELQAALDSGFDGVVVKPFAVESLLDRIAALDPSPGEAGAGRPSRILGQ